MVFRQGSRGTWLHASAALFALLVGIGALAVSTQAGALLGLRTGDRGSGIGDRRSEATLPAAPIPDPRSPIPGGLVRGDAGLGTQVSGPERGDSCPAAYTISEATGAQIVAGTGLVPGSRCDDCQADLALPFSYNLYGTPYSAAKVSSNGNIQLNTNTNVFANACLPFAPLSTALMPYWDDLRTDAGAGDGIFTSVSGSAPNRIFNIEWKATAFVYPGQSANFEVRLYEGENRFDFVYGTVLNGGSGVTVGVQQDGGGYTQYSCNTSSLSEGRLLTFVLAPPACTPTATATPAPVATATPGSAPIILGHATWDGRPDQPDVGQELPISLTLRLVTGGPYIEYPFQNTNASGYFTVSVAGLVNGAYYWRAWSPHYLANSGTVELDGAPVTRLEVGLMRAGDANEDNVVNLPDFIIQSATYNRVCGDPAYQGRADFTGDCAVDARDFSVLRRNFGTAGAPPP